MAGRIAAMIGALLNLAVFLPLAADSTGGVGAVLGLLVIAGFFGVLALPRHPYLGGLLVLAGVTPNLLMLIVAFAHFPYGLAVGALLILPLPLMVLGILRFAATGDQPGPAVFVESVTFRCRRCGVRFTPYPNAWNNAGYCSKKCVICDR